MVVSAASGDDSAEAHEALAALCQAYWRPLYEYILHRGYREADAQDLTQEFFTRLIDKNYAGQADRDRGRFRSFLLGSVKHFLSSEARHARAGKRGGGRIPVSLEHHTEDGRQFPEPQDEQTPDKIFERRWALTVIEHALQALSEMKHFEHLRQFVTDGGEAPAAYGVVGAQLGMTEGAVKVAVHRMRRRFGQSLRAEIARTVESDSKVDDELRHLLAAMQG